MEPVLVPTEYEAGGAPQLVCCSKEEENMVPRQYLSHNFSAI